MYTLSKPYLSSLLPIGLAIPTLLYATEPPTAPILRIETGMHLAQINSISVDATEQFLVTASYDKTLRLWELATGKLLITYRIPMGEGDEGKLLATAISPKGSWVAGAGWTGYEWDGIHSIYLFNRQTGELERRLLGLEQVTNHLCVSPDGQYLAAILGGYWGLRIWNTQTWQPVFRDDDYGDSSYRCDFDSQNRVLTTSFDGSIRLYTPTADTFNLITKSEAPGGQYPYSVAFSPSGDQIAVGFYDSTSVNVLNGQNLALLYATDTSGVDNGNWASVAWSQDGPGLYSGGEYYNNNGMIPILYWSQPEQGSYVEWPVATNTLTGILALKGGGVVYGAGDPAFGVLDKDGNKVLERQGDIADYRGIYLGSFGISPEGSIVQFGFKPVGEHPARFSVADQQLILNPSPDNSLLAPDTTSLNIANWEGNYEPQLNDVLLPLKPYEISHSLAIAPDHSKFLLGTEWRLLGFDATGKQLWEATALSATYGVNISGDGKIGLAAFGDGTLRWYNLETGQELLAFFPHNDEKRWIAWTPSGYYMSSGEEAENLIGWQVNNGKDKAAMFYPASALKASRNRPDIVKKVLTTLDEAEAIRLANLEQGGGESVISVAEGLRKVQDKYQVNLIPSSLGQAIIVAASGEQETNLLFPYTNEFTQEMYRFLRLKGFSDGDLIYLNPYPPVVPSDGYVNAARQDFSMREPTQELEQAIAKASQNLQAGQQFIFYLHGHADPKLLRIGRTEVLSAAQLKTLLAPIPTNVQQIIILDTCYSGSFLTELAGVPNRILVTSADADAKAWSNEGGSFAESFIYYLRSGSSLWESFKLAKSDLAKDPTTFGNQSPQLDDTQDGIFDERDGQLARTIFLGGQKVHGSLPPEIVTIHPPIQLAPGQQKATLWVTVVPSFEAIQTVHAILTNEHDQATEYQGETTPFSRRELVLKPNYSLQRYEVEYDQFDTANSWKIRYEAQGLEGDWSPVKVGYALAQGAAIPTSVRAVLNHTVYHLGDNFRFDITAQGTETVDVYAGVIFPPGPYYTLAYPTTFSPANTFQPYQTEVALLGESTWRVLNLTLPVIDKGDYQACALLTKPAADPKRQENWLSFHCQSLQVN